MSPDQSSARGRDGRPAAFFCLWLIYVAVDLPRASRAPDVGGLSSGVGTRTETVTRFEIRVFHEACIHLAIP
jgi:hypothetical protein